MKLILIITLLITLNTECFAHSAAAANMRAGFERQVRLEQMANDAENALRVKQASLAVCNAKLASSENLVIKEARQKHESEQNKLINAYEAALMEKNQTVISLTEKLQNIPSYSSCETEDSSSHQMYGKFFAKLAIKQSLLEPETRSAEIILFQNNLFRQYLYLNFPEYKNLVDLKAQEKIALFMKNITDDFLKLAEL